MNITYSKNSMELRHPSGIIQRLSCKNLLDIIAIKEQQIADITKDIETFNLYLTETQKIVKGL